MTVATRPPKAASEMRPKQPDITRTILGRLMEHYRDVYPLQPGQERSIVLAKFQVGNQEHYPPKYDMSRCPPDLLHLYLGHKVAMLKQLRGADDMAMADEFKIDISKDATLVAGQATYRQQIAEEAGRWPKQELLQQ